MASDHRTAARRLPRLRRLLVLAGGGALAVAPVWSPGSGLAETVRSEQAAGAATAAVGPARAPTSDRDGLLEFDIPAMPLDAALDRFGDITGREVLYAAALGEGRRSQEVVGTFRPIEALARLLSATGLDARFLVDGSFVLAPGRPDPAGPIVAHYYGRLQSGLAAALCGTKAVLGGDRRVAALLWMGAGGRVTRAVRLGSSGNADRDRAIDAALHRVDVGAPPRGVGQPMLVMIVPAELRAKGCATTAVAGRAP